jgi:hypothetical protein
MKRNRSDEREHIGGDAKPGLYYIINRTYVQLIIGGCISTTRKKEAVDEAVDLGF